MTIQAPQRTKRTDTREAPRTYWLAGNRLTNLEDQTTTQGHYDLTEGHKLPGDRTPPHRHTRYAELLYVMDGEMTVWLGKDEVTLRPGDRLTIRSARRTSSA